MIESIEDFAQRVKSKLSIFESNDFIFEEEKHIYTYAGNKLDSVTTFLKNFKEPFQKDYWASKKAAERGISKEEILLEWKNKADASTDLGTEVHKWIEDFYNGLNPELPQDPRSLSRVLKFKTIYELSLHRFHPIASEVRVFSRKWGLAGTIDQLFAFHDEKQDKNILVIGDWKTNAELKTDKSKNGRFKKLLRPFNDLYENNLSEYSIQLSLYRAILEQSGIETHSAFLCHIGPDEPAKLYKTYDLRERLKIYLDANRSNGDIFQLD